MSTSPIADLSYRGYDGPLDAPDYRWWAITKMMMRLQMKKKWAWVGFGFGFFYVVAMVFILFIFDSFANSARGPQGLNPAQEFINRIVWPDQFLHIVGFAQIPLFIVMLVVGAGTIANDTRANALLVYLSKPCTKLDYVIGKWMGVFLPLLFTMLVPALAFFVYGAMSYRGEGFFSDDPWILPKLLLLYPIAAAWMASMVIGFSSFFNQGRIAGAVLAGIYFLSNFVTQLMRIPFFDNEPGMEAPQALAGKLYYCSIDGLNIGLAKVIIGTDGSPPFGIPLDDGVKIPAPPGWMVFPLVFGIAIVGLLIAWRRVRAVEVVG